MVATKMFWDMWRNLTNATSNWTISSSTSSSSSLSKSKSSRYNRLRSLPTKSCSQPANLAGLTSSAEAKTSCLRFLDNDDDDEYVGVGQQEQHQQKNCRMENINVDRTTITPKKGTIKHSFTTASFLPFSSFRAENECTSKQNGTAAVATRFEMAPSTAKYPQSTQVNFAKGTLSNKGGNSNSSSNADVGRIPISGVAEKNFSTQPMSTTITAASGGSSSNIGTTGNQDIRQQKEELCVVENDIPNLDVDETDTDAWDHFQLQCDVCDRNFATYRQLADHQRKKRHYGCLQCDTLYETQEGLDIHREQMCHYEFAIDMAGYRDYGDGQDGDDSDSFVTDDDENGFGYSDDGDDEEMERLL